MPNAMKEATAQTSITLGYVRNSSNLLAVGMFDSVQMPMPTNSTCVGKSKDLGRLKDDQHRAATVNWASM